MIIRKTLRNAALISGYSVIAWGLWAMPAPAGPFDNLMNTDSAALAALDEVVMSEQCKLSASVGAFIVRMHDDYGFSVEHTKGLMRNEGLTFTPMHNMGVSLAKYAIIDEADRQEIKADLWRLCVETVKGVTEEGR